ncbi:ABC transporter substrate-binding protein [Kingella negevensis]|uniref:ABC transporter substrate-binding protein n=1 Tax=Kingella negevensis TaxID=1522312 RepID=UPI00050A2673|nr:ABC transporter substrate-binding protein [Kingella negevensis]
MKIKTLAGMMMPMFLLAACNNSPAPSEAEKPASSESKPAAAAPQNNDGKTYTVASLTAYPPFVNRNQKGQLEGLDMDLLQEIAKKEGFNVQFVPYAMGGLFEALNTGNVDIVASGINITPEREQQFTFTKPYMEGNWGVTADKTKSQFNSLADLKDKKVAAQKASSSETKLKESGITDQIVPIETVYLGLNGIARGDVDAVYDVDVVLNTYTKSQPNYYTIPDPKAGKITMGWVLKKGNNELKAKLDKGIDDLKANGTYQKIVSKWVN